MRCPAGGWSLASRRGGRNGPPASRAAAVRRRRTVSPAGHRPPRLSRKYRPPNASCVEDTGAGHSGQGCSDSPARNGGFLPLIDCSGTLRSPMLCLAVSLQVCDPRRAVSRGVGIELTSHSPRLGGDVAHAPATPAHTPTETTPEVRPPGERRRRWSTVTAKTRDEGTRRMSPVPRRLRRSPATGDAADEDERCRRDPALARGRGRRGDVRDPRRRDHADLRRDGARHHRAARARAARAGRRPHGAGLRARLRTRRRRDRDLGARGHEPRHPDRRRLDGLDARSSASPGRCARR